MSRLVPGFNTPRPHQACSDGIAVGGRPPVVSSRMANFLSLQVILHSHAAPPDGSCA